VHRRLPSLVVIRRITQGTRGEKGNDALTRYWSVKVTCELQGKSFLDYFKRCMAARRNGEPILSIFE
jgi:hypothetical protein